MVTLGSVASLRTPEQDAERVEAAEALFRKAMQIIEEQPAAATGEHPVRLWLQARWWAKHDGGKEQALACACKLELKATGSGGGGGGGWSREGQKSVGNWRRSLRARLGRKADEPSTVGDEGEAIRGRAASRP